MKSITPPTHNAVVTYKYDEPGTWRYFYGKIPNAPLYGLVSSTEHLNGVMPVLIEDLNQSTREVAQDVVSEQVGYMARLRDLIEKQDLAWEEMSVGEKALLTILGVGKS